MPRNDSYTRSITTKGPSRFKTAKPWPKIMNTKTKNTKSLSGVGQLGLRANSKVQTNAPIKPINLVNDIFISVNDTPAERYLLMLRAS